jgi:SAM-dependent methyltransferase
MPPIRIYTSKAEVYAHSRWQYAPAAVNTIAQVAGLTKQSTVVELGAGTGILTRPLQKFAGAVFAVEPDISMARWIVSDSEYASTCFVLAAPAECVPLPGGLADLVAAAQAVHWFEPTAARLEINRILKPGGWLALLRNYGISSQLNEALSTLYRSENGVQFESKVPQQHVPEAFYYGNAGYQKFTFPFCIDQDWELFLGGLLSASYAPDEDHPGYSRFVRAVREVFDRFAVQGRVEMQAETELIIGQVH